MKKFSILFLLALLACGCNQVEINPESEAYNINEDHHGGVNAHHLQWRLRKIEKQIENLHEDFRKTVTRIEDVVH